MTGLENPRESWEVQQQKRKSVYKQLCIAVQKGKICIVATVQNSLSCNHFISAHTHREQRAKLVKRSQQRQLRYNSTSRTVLIHPPMTCQNCCLRFALINPPLCFDNPHNPITTPFRQWCCHFHRLWAWLPGCQQPSSSCCRS